MELTRRDAAAALAAIGATAGVAVGIDRLGGVGDDGTSPDVSPSDGHVESTLVAAAGVVYPSELSGVETFVRAFLEGRLDGSAHATGLRKAVADLDEHALSWYGDRFAAMPPDERERLLREVGADVAEEHPEGTTAERVRYYVVNELLLALYSSPTGGELVGIENPQGHPGGTESYRRGPQ